GSVQRPLPAGDRYKTFLPNGRATPWRDWSSPQTVRRRAGKSIEESAWRGTTAHPSPPTPAPAPRAPIPSSLVDFGPLRSPPSRSAYLSQYRKDLRRMPPGITKTITRQGG